MAIINNNVSASLAHMRKGSPASGPSVAGNLGSPAGNVTRGDNPLGALQAEPKLPGQSVDIDFSKIGQPVAQESSAPEAIVLSTPSAPAAPAKPQTYQTASGSTLQATANGTLVEFAPDITAVRSLTPADLDLSKGAEVISSAQKFILPVPKFEDGGEPLVYPPGVKNKEGKDIGGQPIADWQGKPIGDKGVVFFNAKDQAWQAVKGDGQGVIIMNQISEQQAKGFMEKIGADPNKLTLQHFKEVLSYAAENGASDMYNSDRSFIQSKMNPLETVATGVPQYGLFRRDDRDVCNVLFVEGSGEFKGPKTTHHFDNGAVILRQANSKADDGFDYRLIQPETFVETYSNKDGSPINLDALPRG